MPYSVECNIKKLLYPQYWRNVDVIHETYAAHIDSITITGTKAKLMAAVSILTSIFDSNDTTNPLVCSSLFSDACQETSTYYTIVSINRKFLNILYLYIVNISDPVYLELLLENINCKKLSSLVTISNELNINSVKVFALNESQQAFIFSGPESNIYGLVFFKYFSSK